MNLDEFLQVGDVIALGTHRFDAASIKAFAAKYDPQRFHMDEELARGSVFGSLCASGWHTCAAWMKCNVATPVGRQDWIGPGLKPEIGPSPGFKNLKWLKPVYAGETVSYTRQVMSHRPVANRPGWHRVTTHNEGFDSTGAKVLAFDSDVLVRFEERSR